MGYREIEDIVRIEKLGKRLDKILRSHGVASETRRIGYPGGHENTKVLFLEKNGDDSLWYAHWVLPQQNKMITLLGHGKFGDDEWLPIDIQFNLPLNDYHRRLGAAFLEDVDTGEVFLAHRAILTLGHRIPKDQVLNEMVDDVVEVATSRRTDEYLFVTSLDSKTLVDDLSIFSRRLRKTVQSLAEKTPLPVGAIGAEEDEPPPKRSRIPAKRPVPGAGVDALRVYFEEFSGQRRAFTPSKVVAVSHHGKVVHALYESMSKRGNALKSRAVDLVVDLDQDAILFEVKTKADSQSIYTAVGQLAVHAPTVKSALAKTVKKVLVIPERPMSTLEDIFKNDLDIQIVTYKMSTNGRVVLNGLNDL